MKRSIPIFIFLSAIFFGCGSSTNTSSNTQNPHAVAHQKMHNELVQEELNKSLKDVTTPVAESSIKTVYSDHPKAAYYKDKWDNETSLHGH